MSVFLLHADLRKASDCNNAVESGVGKTTVKAWEEGKSYKSRRILHTYYYTLRVKLSLRFKQLNLEIINDIADLCSNKRPWPFIKTQE